MIYHQFNNVCQTSSILGRSWKNDQKKTQGILLQKGAGMAPLNIPEFHEAITGNVAGKKSPLAVAGAYSWGAGVVRLRFPS